MKYLGNTSLMNFCISASLVKLNKEISKKHIDIEYNSEINWIHFPIMLIIGKGDKKANLLYQEFGKFE